MLLSGDTNVGTASWFWPPSISSYMLREARVQKRILEAQMCVRESAH